MLAGKRAEGSGYGVSGAGTLGQAMAKATQNLPIANLGGMGMLPPHGSRKRSDLQQFHQKRFDFAAISTGPSNTVANEDDPPRLLGAPWGVHRRLRITT